MSITPHISVIVPTFNRPAILSLVLAALCNQARINEVAEVFVICDGFDEATRSVAESYAERLPLCYVEQRKKGVSHSRNRGIFMSSSPLVLLLDDDVVPGPGLIEEHIRFHQEQPDENAVLLGYVTWHHDLHCSPFMRWYGEYGGIFGYGLLKDNARAKARFFYSCNISLKRAFLSAHGAFNEDLMVLEDNELGFRLERQGMQLFFRKAAVGFHYQTFTFEQACRRLESYSKGLRVFLHTEAGKNLAQRRRRLIFRIAERAVRIIAPFFRWLVPVVNSEIALPHGVYRLLYWHYGTYRSFWAKAESDC